MSGNPVPQHNPTDGLNVAAQIYLTADGQGGSLLSTVVAGREYQIILSLSAKSGWDANSTITAAVVDIKGGVYDVQQAVTVNDYNTSVASVSAVSASATGGSFVLTAVAVGEAQVDVVFPTFDTTDGTDKIYVRLRVVVII